MGLYVSSNLPVPEIERPSSLPSSPPFRFSVYRPFSPRGTRPGSLVPNCNHEACTANHTDIMLVSEELFLRESFYNLHSSLALFCVSFVHSVCSLYIYSLGQYNLFQVRPLSPIRSRHCTISS